MKKTVYDHLNRKVAYNFPPKKIISLVPSQTELLYDLGLANEIIGITRFCIHPKNRFKEKTKIGGTKNFDFDKIRALKPDLIIGNKEENYKEGIEELAKEFPVWISEIYTFEDNLKMISDIGNLCNKKQESDKICEDILKEFSKIKIPTIKKTVAYIIWQNPIMSINNNTFINNILEKSGYENIFRSKKERYPEISEEELKIVKPDFIFLSSEPYPFKERNRKEYQNKFPESKIILVDGEMFSWYGSRLRFLPKYIQKELYVIKKIDETGI